MIGLPLIKANNQHIETCSPQGHNDVHKLSFPPHFTIYLEPSDNSYLETGGSIWHAGYELARYLVHHPDIVEGKRVLELGCGCGLVGLVAAALGASCVCLTDLEVQVPYIQRNIELNRDLFSQTDCIVTCKPYPFGSLAHEIFADNDDILFDIILGADIAYDVQLHDPIIQSLVSLRSRELPTSSIDILLAEEIRWKDIYEWYRQNLSTAFTEVITVERYVSDEHNQMKTTSAIEIFRISS